MSGGQCTAQRHHRSLICEIRNESAAAGPRWGGLRSNSSAWGFGGRQNGRIVCLRIMNCCWFPRKDLHSVLLTLQSASMTKARYGQNRAKYACDGKTHASLVPCIESMGACRIAWPPDGRSISGRSVCSRCWVQRWTNQKKSFRFNVKKKKKTCCIRTGQRPSTDYYTFRLSPAW